nr:DNA gyrase inhibitor YacG [Anaeromyxobacter sp. SG22]
MSGVPRACPICGKPVPPRTENRAFPFCSDRCRLLDLGKWLGEEYRVPGPRAGDGVEVPAPPSEPDGDDA